MKINDRSSHQGIFQDARFLLGLQINDTGSYSDNELYRNTNAWHRRVNSWILQAIGTWEYDDEKWTTLPIATTTLVVDQQDYELPADCQKVIRVEVKNNDGDLFPLVQIDQTEVGSALAEYYEDNGLPIKYDIIGRSIFVYPKPAAADVTLAAGLKLYYLREIKEFAITETSTEPGFADNFHRILAYGAAYNYATAKGLETKKQWLKGETEVMKGELLEFYGSRNLARKLRMNPSDEGIIGRI